MALSANTVWEVRNGGNNTNGGGFVTGSSGTDWTQQDSPQYSVTDGVTAGTTTITSATASFGTDVVGNLIYVQGGTGSVTAGWYQITARTNSTTITVDRSTGLTAGTGVTLKIGGGFATPSQPITAGGIPSNRIFIKYHATPYTITSSLALGFGNVTPGVYNRITGYYSTRGDITPSATAAGTVLRPIIKLSGSSLSVSVNNNGWLVENIDVDCDSQTSSTGIFFNGVANCAAINCRVSNFRSYGFRTTGTTYFSYCEATGGLSGAAYGIASSNGTSTSIRNCYIHDNVCSGVFLGTGGNSVAASIIESNSGASSDGIYCGSGTLITDNTIYNNGRDGILDDSATGIWRHWKRNIISNNGRYGINSNLAVPASYDCDGNAYYSNTSGNRNNCDSTANNSAAGAYTNTLDVILSGSPFVDGPNGNFALNNTSGAGAACRAAGFPGTFPGGLTTSYLDMGASQHQDAGGGGTVYKNMRVLGG